MFSLRARASAAAALLLVAALAPPVSAAGPTVTVVADGLDNPRGLAFGPDGALYVAEAGSGGAGPCMPGPEGGDVCLGTSGAVTRITSGSQRRVVTGLPSAAAPDGSFAGGPSDVAFQGLGSLYVPVNLGADPAIRGGLPPSAAALGWLVRANVRTGAWTPVRDVAGYEATHNPDTGAIDSNPYAALALPSGQAVADAGGNDVLWFPNGAGRPVRVAVFPDRLVDAPPFVGLPPGAQIPMEAVPNSIVRGPDGAWYVGELTGFPFPVGGARVYRIVPGHDPEVFATGFTNIIDLAFAPDGSLLVLEIAHNGLLSGNLTGGLVRVAPDGTQTLLMTDGLVAPGGITVGASGDAYVSNFGVFPGAGQVLRISW